jgi:hypothetical protein
MLNAMIVEAAKDKRDRRHRAIKKGDTVTTTAPRGKDPHAWRTSPSIINWPPATFQGEPIVKYGEHIGLAAGTSRGRDVHCHN